MTDFIRRGPRDVFLIQLLVESVPGFALSPEYLAIDESDKQLPYILAARIGDYWERLEIESGHSSDRVVVLDSVTGSFESLAGHPDAHVQDLLVLGILHRLHSQTPLETRMRNRLGPKARRLFDTVGG